MKVKCDHRSKSEKKMIGHRSRFRENDEYLFSEVQS